MPPTEHCTLGEALAALEAAGLRPTVPNVVNRFLLAKRAGDLIFVSSVTPLRSDGSEIRGSVPDERSLDEACEAARLCAANSLVALTAVVDDDTAIETVDVLVFVNAVAGFGEQSVIADAASQLLEELLGERGRHTRGAIGAESLVRDSTVVLKAIYAVSRSDGT